jgi:lipopolysaccharide biosynthesis glycosyltransferase
MCVDHGFTLPLAAALASIDRVSGQDSVLVHVVHPGFSEETRERVTSGLSNIEVSWRLVDEGTIGGAYYTDYLTPASLYRLLLGEILPAEVTRVLYLDADIVALSSLAPAYAVELNGAVVGAVRDAGAPWAAGYRGLAWRQLGVPPSSPNFNSGVLLIDLERWRAEAIGEKCLDLLRRENPRWGDQDALNVILEGRWLELPRRWNLQTADLSDYSLAWAHWPQDIEDALRSPSIIHYTERDKPWNAGSLHPMAAKWFEALDRTAWSGWRPRRPPERPLIRKVLTVLRSIRDRRAQRYSRLPE